MNMIQYYRILSVIKLFELNSIDELFCSQRTKQFVKKLSKRRNKEWLWSFQ